jgi:hypothetical protein
MHSAVEFAELLARNKFPYGAVMYEAEKLIAARDAALWRMAQEQMKEKISQHVPLDYGKCSCGLRWRKIDSTNPYGDLQEHIRSIPLDPLPAGDAGEPDWDAIQKNERISEGYDDMPNNLGADQE